MLPRDLFEDLAENIGKESAEKLANSIEKFLEFIATETQKEIVEKKENVKAELYNELRTELATKEFVRAEIKQNNLLLKVLIGISLFAITLLNPNFIDIVENIFAK